MTIAAKIIADSISPANIRLTTMQLRYPKFIHGEFMTHRMFSRNASSSRAIPVERLIEDVLQDTVYPMHWGKNEKGMQASQENDEPIRWDDPPASSYNRGTAWDIARQSAVDHARAFAKAGYHKQIVNRLLEPFCHINVVVTSTEWANFFALRCHEGAQPEMRILAEAMYAAMQASVPQRLDPGDWHLPYGPIPTKTSEVPGVSIKLSVARCARVSYLTQDGRPPDVLSDIGLYERLVGSTPLHASPAEHQATPDVLGSAMWIQPQLHGNFRGWIQFRKILPNECVQDF